MTGQHDWQDERLTGQLPNQFGRRVLISHNFEPWTTLECQNDMSSQSSHFVIEY